MKEKVITQKELSEFLLSVSSGFSDGLNPCALVAIISLAGFFLWAGYKRQEILAAGFFFVAAVFMVWIFYGLGLLDKVRDPLWFDVMARAVYFLVSVLLIAAGVANGWDWWVYQNTGDGTKMILKFHAITGRETPDTLKRGNLFQRTLRILKISLLACGAGFFMSFLGLETAGHIYFPVIIKYMLMTAQTQKAFLYLTAYSSMFIAPLLIACALMVIFLPSQRFISGAQRHFSKIKIAAAAVFLGSGSGLLLALVVFYSF